MDHQQTQNRFWASMPNELKQRAARILRRDAPDLVTFIEHCHVHGIDWEDQLSTPIDLGNGQQMPYPFHMAGGMEIRNILRASPDGIPDHELPPQDWYYGEGTDFRNWDDQYAQALEFAAGIRE